MNFRKVFLMAVLCVLIVPNAFADMFVSQPYCSKPYKPYEFNSDYEVDSYVRDVENYIDCLTSFINEQYEEAQNHINAAETASRELNNYLSTLDY